MPAKLTPRQKEVVAYLRDHPWQTQDEAAAALKISVSTLQNHLNAAYRVYGIEGGTGQKKLPKLMQKIAQDGADS